MLQGFRASGFRISPFGAKFEQFFLCSLKKITLDVRPELHYRLRLLSVVLDRSIASLASEAVEKLLDGYPSVTAEALRVGGSTIGNGKATDLP